MFTIGFVLVTGEYYGIQDTSIQTQDVLSLIYWQGAIVVFITIVGSLIMRYKILRKIIFSTNC